MPSTPFMGVRISWLMRARNSLLERLAASAWSRWSSAERFDSMRSSIRLAAMATPEISSARPMSGNLPERSAPVPSPCRPALSCASGESTRPRTQRIANRVISTPISRLTPTNHNEIRFSRSMKSRLVARRKARVEPSGCTATGKSPSMVLPCGGSICNSAGRSGTSARSVVPGRTSKEVAASSVWSSEAMNWTSRRRIMVNQPTGSPLRSVGRMGAVAHW